MSVFIFNRSTKFDYYNWLSDSSPVIYAASEKPLNTPGKYKLVRRFDSLNTGLADKLVLEISKKTKLNRIVSQSEYDVIRAATLREYLDIEGQSLESAHAYRNKVVMKDYLNRAGIKTAAYRKLDSSVDLIKFVHNHGYPVVVKPIDLAGSRGVELLRSEQDLNRYLSVPVLRPYMVERFVNGKMYHVNGIFYQNQYHFIAAYKYINTSLDYQSHGCYGSMTMDPETILSKNLISFCKRVIAALPQTDPLAFHAEIFYTDNGEFLLNEIASRTAGSLIVELMEKDYGFNLSRSWVRSQCGLDPEIQPDSQPISYSASLMFPTRNAVLRNLPFFVPFSWCSNLYVNGKQGVQNAKAATYTDDVLSIIISGQSEKEVMSRVNEASEWLDAEILWVKVNTA
ncbi:hypothetical protein CAP48_17700 [Advenella sp. S44]|uniref:ATP-grasp domain-containing protein n=1 Tax=Advenella sp. S44 TaxID=1982755 RepID=UPI000C29D4EA|nr:ATP-grasp domain-containing protein [Advenella sp. S44]PJX21136.1 hypothetical protein CAP48_17700 [Advenella sp. S44]